MMGHTNQIWTVAIQRVGTRSFRSDSNWIHK